MHRQIKHSYRSQEGADVAVKQANHPVINSTDAVINLAQNFDSPEMTLPYTVEQSLERTKPVIKSDLTSPNKEVRTSFEAIPNRGSPIHQGSALRPRSSGKQSAASTVVNMYGKNYVLEQRK